ncbi:response regulator [Spirosoma humi]
MNKVGVICVVDDQADFRFIVQKLFSLSFPQYPVILFEHGQALLNALPQLEQLPSLILMDRHMPVMDGYQTLLQLKQNPAYQLIPVVMMSAEANSDEIRDCYRAGANSFIRKQVEFKNQLDMITQMGQYWLQTNLPSE